jgi:hypothetical protein
LNYTMKAMELSEEATALCSEARSLFSVMREETKAVPPAIYKDTDKWPHIVHLQPHVEWQTIQLDLTPLNKACIVFHRAATIAEKATPVPRAVVETVFLTFVSFLFNLLPKDPPAYWSVMNQSLSGDSYEYMKSDEFLRKQIRASMLACHGFSSKLREGKTEAVDKPLLLLIKCSQHGWDRLSLRLPKGLGLYLKYKLQELAFAETAIEHCETKKIRISSVSSKEATKDQKPEPEQRQLNGQRFRLITAPFLEWPAWPDDWMNKMKAMVKKGISKCDAEAIAPLRNIALETKITFLDEGKSGSMHRAEACAFLTRALQLPETTPWDLENRWNFIGLPTVKTLEEVKAWVGKLDRQKTLPIAEDTQFKCWVEKQDLCRSEIEKCFQQPSRDSVPAQSYTGQAASSSSAACSHRYGSWAGAKKAANRRGRKRDKPG